jgi:hypothetical protein
MPFTSVGDEMGRFKRGELHSGSTSGPVVKSRAQAIAISLSEKRKAAHDAQIKALTKHGGK